MSRVALDPRRWPLAFKAPTLVAGLTIAVAIGISNVVLSRLTDLQEKHLRDITGTYLDGLSTAVMPHVLRHDIWETFDVLDRAQGRYAAVKALNTIVALPDQSILAASHPGQYPVHSVLPKEIRARVDAAAPLSIDEEDRRAWAFRPLKEGGISIGSLIAEIDIADLIRYRQQILLTLIAVNAGLTVLFAFAGYILVRRMLRPLSLLGRHLEKARDGDMRPIEPGALGAAKTEFGRLFLGYNAMAGAVSEREQLVTRLAAEEKVSLLGKLTSGMAHEVNNPLGGMFNALTLLRRHGDDPSVREQAASLIERGLTGIRNVVRATLVMYKGDARRQQLTHGDLDDLKFLIKHEIERKRIQLDWRNDLPMTVEVDGQLVRQAALNLLLNACAASPLDGVIRFFAELRDQRLTFSVADQGPGLPEPAIDILRRRPMSPPIGNSGLGVWTVARAAQSLNAEVLVVSSVAGSAVTVSAPAGPVEGLNAVA